MKKRGIERPRLAATEIAADVGRDNPTRRTSLWPTSGCPDTVRTFSCKEGSGCCVSARLRLVVVSCYKDYLLYVYGLDTGTLLRTLGKGKGSASGELHFWIGDACFGPCGNTVMVADECNNRVSELSVMDGAVVGLHGDGILKRPRYIDCNTETSTLAVTCDECSIQLVHLRTGNVSTVYTNPAWVYLLKPHFYGPNGVIVFGEMDRRSCIKTWAIKRVTPGFAADVTYETPKHSWASWDAVLPFCGPDGEMQCIVSDYSTGTVGCPGDCEMNLWRERGFNSCAVVALKDESGTVVVRGHWDIRVLRNRELRFTWLAVVVFACSFSK